MIESSSPASRRRWLGWMSAASLSTGLLDAAPAPAGADAPGTRIYNILDFGAKGDGKTLDTDAAQAAIGARNKDRGGTVLVAAGVFVIGTVEMKSNVTLHIAAEGKLLGGADGKHNCDVQAQDDACALFGSYKFVTVTNSTFSTRWSVFRFGGGNPGNIVHISRLARRRHTDFSPVMFAG